MVVYNIKCRDCTFRSNDLLEVQEHSANTGHRDFALMSGGEVVVDWIHIEMEIMRREPE